MRFYCMCEGSPNKFIPIDLDKDCISVDGEGLGVVLNSSMIVVKNGVPQYVDDGHRRHDPNTDMLQCSVCKTTIMRE